MATGLGRQRGAAEAFQQVPHSKSRVGVEALVNCTADAFNEGTIYMSIGQDGYAGLTKVSDSKMHIAAAVDRESLRDLGPQAIVQRILDETGQRKSFDDLSDDISWRGTPALTTCAKQLAGDRVLLVGDARKLCRTVYRRGDTVGVEVRYWRSAVVSRRGVGLG